MKIFTLFYFALFATVGVNFAQRTVEFRITTVSSNGNDLDGALAGDSDFQWDFRINDECGQNDDSDNFEQSGTNCPGTRTINNTFFSYAYACDLPNFNFEWRGFEDDGAGSDANTGYQNVAINGSTLTSGSFVNIATYTATAGGANCSGGGTITYTITLQYRVTGSRAACTADLCSNPLVLPSPAQYVCGPSQTTTTLNTTINAPQSCGRGSAESTNGIRTECGNSIIERGNPAPPQDIWVRTRIPANTGGAVIQFENLGGCTGFACVTNISYAWYTSSNGNCSGLQFRGCGSVSCFFGCGNGQIAVDGRAGEDVWVRIWEEDDQGFSIRFNQIRPSPPADRCYTAMPLTGVGCNYGATSPSSGLFSEPSINLWTALAHPGGLCQDGDHNILTNTIWASNENLVWYTYTQPTTGPFSIAVDNMACSGGAGSAQLGLFRNLGTPASPTCNLATTSGMGCSVGVGPTELVLASLPAGNYILVVDGNAGAQCSWVFRDRINGTVLPVRWIGFEGKLSDDEKSIQLTWQTGEEEQNQGFEIQRSLDGLNFNKISFVESNYSGTYEFIDAEYPSAPVVYYRLRQLDYNGEYTFSDVVAVTTHADNSGLSTVHEVYPNPAQNQITVPFVTAKDDIINVMIYDMSGRLVLYPVNGRGYTTGQHFIQIELPADMPRGLYNLRFESQQGSQVKRFLLE